MPNITSAGTYTKTDPGFSFLGSAGGRNRTLLFAGTLNGATVNIQYVDDQGVPQAIENGGIAVLPKSIEIGLLALDLQITVTGTPAMNVTFGGVESVIQSG